uniref:SPRY domain-containing protein 7 isoform X1 n=1 Tax=Halichoerus grypus TaxID=9711 RepID=UPI0016595F6B|nr:SPRY domain-containing protein 7 isoform X1 [Halichoerus grypus]
MAASVFCCLRCCRDGGTGHIPLKEMPAVQLDTQHMGTDVVIVKNGRRICGTGGCLASAPLHQNKSYFEFKIQSTGIWGIGVATQKVNLNQIPLGRDVHSLVMRNDGALYHNNEEKNRLPANNLPQEGDVVGITYDHVELNVYLNGKNMHCPASGIRGTVYPVVYDDLTFYFIKKRAVNSELHLPTPALLKLFSIKSNLAFLSHLRRRCILHVKNKTKQKICLV